jgi:hypothetical protein
MDSDGCSTWQVAGLTARGVGGRGWGTSPGLQSGNSTPVTCHAAHAQATIGTPSACAHTAHCTQPQTHTCRPGHKGTLMRMRPVLQHHWLQMRQRGWPCMARTAPARAYAHMHASSANLILLVVWRQGQPAGPVVEEWQLPGCPCTCTGGNAWHDHCTTLPRACNSTPSRSSHNLHLRSTQLPTPPALPGTRSDLLAGTGQPSTHPSFSAPSSSCHPTMSSPTTQGVRMPHQAVITCTRKVQATVAAQGAGCVRKHCSGSKRSSVCSVLAGREHAAFVCCCHKPGHIALAYQIKQQRHTLLLALSPPHMPQGQSTQSRRWYHCRIAHVLQHTRQGQSCATQTTRLCPAALPHTRTAAAPVHVPACC